MRGTSTDGHFCWNNLLQKNRLKHKGLMENDPLILDHKSCIDNRLKLNHATLLIKDAMHFRTCKISKSE